MWTLNMLQAHRGDFLVLEESDRRVIVDTGTKECTDELARRLAVPGCELLVITHLDDDHFGGLQALVQDALQGKATGIHWPKKVWLNHFEAGETIGAFRSGMRHDGGAIELLGQMASAVAMRNAERPLRIALQRAPRINREKQLDEPLMTVEADEEAAAFLRGRGVERSERDPERSLDGRVSFYVEHLANGCEVCRPVLESESHRRQLFQAIQRELQGIDDTGDRSLRIRRSGSPRTTITFSDPDLYEQVVSGEVPPGLPEGIRGMLHQQKHGAAMIERTRQVLTLVAALERLGIEVETVEDRHDASFGDLHLFVVGPDHVDLAALEREWDRIREKGSVHAGFLRMGLSEATMFSAIAGKYRLDRSVTNRSSIQLIARGREGWALLTGDGRPDTLERTLTDVPELPCRVFKAAHHGSPYNIRMKSPNAMLRKLQPDNVWVSGAGHHPPLEFLRLLETEAVGPKRFAIAVTNANEAVASLRRRLKIQVMKKDAPFSCTL